MAIQPIDLQTLFTQVDKVGKSQASQRDGLAVHQAMQGIQIQRKTEELMQAVNQAQNTGEGAEKINDRREQKQGQARREKKEREEHEEQAAESVRSTVNCDPGLGKNIDISL